MEKRSRITSRERIHTGGKQWVKKPFLFLPSRNFLMQVNFEGGIYIPSHSDKVCRLIPDSIDC